MTRNVRAKRRETPSKSHAIAIAQEARKRGMDDVHVYRKHGLFGTKYVVTYLDDSRGEKAKKGLKAAGGHTKRGIRGLFRRGKKDSS
jgi:hypothetical protein